MNQKDFSKIRSMNINSDIIFANQADVNSYDEYKFGVHTAKMVTTNSRGVGINRNIALMYADAEYCLFADDDVVYRDNMEEIIINEFETHSDADVFIFHLDTDDQVRKQRSYVKTRKVKSWEQMPWGGFRIAIRLSSVRKANIWFTTLFGGGCKFPSGEDSMWLRDAKAKGLRFYVSDKTIGRVSFNTSTWFTGRNEKYYYGQGAYCEAVHQKCTLIWLIYYSLRTANNSMLSFSNRLCWLKKGTEGYKKMFSYEEYLDWETRKGKDVT